MRFEVMPFGMVNSGSAYNRMIRKLLDGSHNLESYVANVLGHTENCQNIWKFFETQINFSHSHRGPVSAKSDLTRSNFLVAYCMETA